MPKKLILTVIDGLGPALLDRAVAAGRAPTLAHLQELGYSPTDDQMMSYRMTFLPFVILLMVFGIIKAIVGTERHHPVGILVFLLIVTAFAGIMLARRPTRTRAGEDVLKAHQASHARASRKTCIVCTVSASGGLTQTWSRRRPLSAAAQSGER